MINKTQKGKERKKVGLDVLSSGGGRAICDITRWPYWGHEAASEDAMLKRGGGVCWSICPWFGGGGCSQLLRQVEETDPRPCVVQCCLVDWNGLTSSKLLGWLKWAHELKVAWLIEMGSRAQTCLLDWSERLRSKWEVWWFSPPPFCS